MRYFFVNPAELQSPVTVIKGAEARHMKTVLRLKAGDEIRLIDGKGFEYEGGISRIYDDRIEIKVMKKFESQKESPVHIEVAQALLKEKKMDRLLRHLCELGIAKWIPYISERSVPKPRENRIPVRLARWEKILKESCKQCQRARLPEIIKIRSFEEVLQYAQSCDLKIVFYEKESATLRSLASSSPKKAPRKILLILGPEGGFSNPEIASAQSSGCAIAGLGPRILRAETATIAACTLVQGLFGDMG